MKKIKLLIVLLLVLVQGYSQSINVRTPQELKTALQGNYRLIQVKKPLNLGELPSTDFPFQIKPGVRLKGEFNLLTNTATKITFPYEYIDGVPCSTNPADRYFQYKGFAFEMKDSSSFENLILEGGQSNIKDWRYFPLKGCNPMYNRKSIEGLSSGIIVTGRGCTIKNSEISGFSFFAVEYVPDIPGDFYFYNNYIHDNKHLGYGYGLWIGQRSTNLICEDLCGKNTPDPVSNVYIKGNIFFRNKHHIAGSGGNSSYIIDSCTFLYSADYNIDRHNTTTTCVDGNLIKDVGGQNTIITNSIFYREASCIGITYPNINCGMQSKNTITNNYFKNLQGFACIQIADIPDYKYWALDTNNIIKDNKTIVPLNIGITGPDFGKKGNTYTFSTTDNSYNYIWEINKKVLKGNVVSYKFSNPGTYTISCIGIKNYMSTDLLTKTIIITSNDTFPYLVFNICDTYRGKVQSTCGNWSTDLNLTGFTKYCQINGKDVWTSDIRGNTGWEYKSIRLKINRGSMNTIEFGIRADKTVSGDSVRGLSFMVDDVYINNSDGTNTVLNGSFETKNTVNDYPSYWTLSDGYQNPDYISCTGIKFNLNPQGSLVNTSSTNTGKYAYYSVIRSFDTYYYPGLRYNIGKYHWIKQEFKIK